MSPAVIIALVQALAEILGSLAKIQAEHNQNHPTTAATTPLSVDHAAQVADAARWIAQAAQQAESAPSTTTTTTPSTTTTSIPTTQPTVP